MKTEELLALGVFGGGSRVGERIARLLERGREFSPRVSTARLAIGGVLLLGCLIAGAILPKTVAFAQARPAFEVASVRPTPPGTHRGTGRGRPSDGPTALQLSSGNLAYSGIVLLEYLQFAYGLKNYQISQPLPRALYEQYDITVKAGRAVKLQEARLMFQSVLEDRFKLKFHLDTKVLPVYALTVGKNGPKLGVGADDGESGVAGVSADGIKWHNISMEYLADWLSDVPPVGRPVLDRTGLSGAYDFTLAPFEGLPDKRAAAEGTRGAENTTGASVFTVIESLGLKLEGDKAPIEYFVIDHVERPNEN
jgi:uncharacterized protein (TIGR03435 family)